MSITIEYNEKVKDSGDVSIDDLLGLVNEKVENKTNSFINFDNFMALEMEYNDNYLKTDLVHICNYYDISTRKKRKDELANEITLFEIEPINIGIVMKRKYLWNCIEELSLDSYLQKFVITMN